MRRLKSMTLQIRQGRPGGGKGALIQVEKAGTIGCGCGHDRTLFQPKRKEPVMLSSNQNDATIADDGVCSTLVASMGMGGGMYL